MRKALAAVFLASFAKCGAAILVRKRHINQVSPGEFLSSNLDENHDDLQLISQHASTGMLNLTADAPPANGSCNCMYFNPGDSPGCEGNCCTEKFGLGGPGRDADCRLRTTSSACTNLANDFGQFYCMWTPNTEDYFWNTRYTTTVPPLEAAVNDEMEDRIDVVSDLNKALEKIAFPNGRREGKHLDYMESGCYKPEHLEYVREVSAPLRMSVPRCFEECKELPGVKYFALTAGHVCYCMDFPVGNRVSEDACSTKCDGNDEQTCGGPFGAESVYNIFDCPTEAEKKEEHHREVFQIIGLYAKMEGESCGHSDSNGSEIDKSPTLNGPAEYCMQACWFGYGAEDCQGFSYDEGIQMCSFVNDEILPGSSWQGPGPRPVRGMFKLLQASWLQHGLTLPLLTMAE